MQSDVRLQACCGHALLRSLRIFKGSASGWICAAAHIQPKGKGKTRPLGIATVKDRIVQGALKLVLEPIFEKEFLPVSFGFRPECSCKDALQIVDRSLKDGFTWVVDADLQSYFDTIPKQSLMQLVKARVSDAKVVNLLQQLLDQQVIELMKQWTPMAGTSQGSVISDQ